MTSISKISKRMQTVLTTVAQSLERSTKFVQRKSKMTGSKFCQTLVFGWLSNPDASLEELSQTAATLGVEITPQGLDQRFTQQAADLLKGVLEQAIEKLITVDPVAIPILQRFTEVQIMDSSTVELPEQFKELYPGCGGSKGPNAAIKIHVMMDFLSGTLQGPVIESRKSSDRSSFFQFAKLPAGALRLADLGYFALYRLNEMNQEGVFWITRVQAGTTIFDQTGQEIDLGKFLMDQKQDQIEINVFLGKNEKIPCRLIAVKVPPEVTNQRRQKLKQEARKKCQSVSKTRFETADWTILATNVPAEMLSIEEVVIIARTRWQIELLFKLWKDQGHIDESRSENHWRMLCEIYAKLIAMIIEHWILLVSCWQYPDRSLTKAAKTVQKYAFNLAIGFNMIAKDCIKHLSGVIEMIKRCLSCGCRINKRKKRPSHFQLLFTHSRDPVLA